MVLSTALVQTDNGQIVYFRNWLSAEIHIFQEIEETDDLPRNWNFFNLTFLIRTPLEITKPVRIRVHFGCRSKIT